MKVGPFVFTLLLAGGVAVEAAAAWPRPVYTASAQQCSWTHPDSTQSMTISGERVGTAWIGKALVCPIPPHHDLAGISDIVRVQAYVWNRSPYYQANVRMCVREPGGQDVCGAKAYTQTFTQGYQYVTALPPSGTWSSKAFAYLRVELPYGYNGNAPRLGSYVVFR